MTIKRDSLVVPNNVLLKRRLFVNIPPPKKYVATRPRFSNNRIRTSKYTLLTFLPKNMYEQFRRFANIFFLILAVMQFFSIFSTINPWIAALPLIVVLFFTAVKDALEDWRRQASDQKINEQLTLRLSDYKNVNEAFVTSAVGNSSLKQEKMRKKSVAVFQARKSKVARPNLRQKTLAVGGRGDRPLPPALMTIPKVHIESSNLDDEWAPIAWENVRVGDIVKISANEQIPADMIVISSSEPDGVFYVETKNLDGETNLKIKTAVPETYCSDIFNGTFFRYFQAVIDVELPTAVIHSFKGTLHFVEDTSPPISTPNFTPGRFFAKMWKSEVSTSPMSPSPFSPLMSPMSPGNPMSPGISSPMSPGGFPREKDPIMTSVPLASQNLLLRGCVLRDTAWVIGIPIYTGKESKVRLNSGETPSKVSMVEQQMNAGVLACLAVLIVISAITAVCGTYFENIDITQQPPWSYATFEETTVNSVVETIITFGVSVLVYQNLVPISLYITLEVVKTVQSYLMYEDIEMYDEERDARSLPKSWNLADDLGQIDYIFTDKTGTLTQNKMEFKKASIHGKLLAPFETTYEKNAHFGENETKDEEQLRHERDFWMCLALCHTVLISKPGEDDDPDETIYKAQSPDEAALVKAANAIGYNFVQRDLNSITIEIVKPGVAPVRKTYTVLHVLEFNSTRKRMSLIVKTPEGKLLLMCKGADNVIFERVSSKHAGLVAATTEHLEMFAAEGFRTLCIAQLYLEKSFYDNWAKQYHSASISMTNREELMEQMAEWIEKDMVLLGATAIEDKLQDGVPDAIHSFLTAGIRMWVLTGDKVETAINIGYACKLLSENMTLIVIKGGSNPNDKGSTLKKLQQSLEMVENHQSAKEKEEPKKKSRPPSVASTFGAREYALVIDGGALFHALEDAKSAQVFVELSTQCSAVLCSRVSPLQKAKVVELIKKTQDAMTLAIGDGANDVGMIQAAHIGVGITGEEGLQASNASDYAIPQFRFLKRLMLVHGHHAYMRFSEMVLSFFYKNIGYTFPLFFYQIHCAFTGSSAYEVDYMYLKMMDLSSKTLTDTPQLYAMGPNDAGYTSLKCFLYFVEGVIHSVGAYFMVYAANLDTILTPDGHTEDVLGFQLAMTVCMFSLLNLFVGFNLQMWNILTVGSNLVSLALVICFVPSVGIFVDGTAFEYESVVFPRLQFWLLYVLVLVVCTLPRFIFRYITRQIKPTDQMVIQEQEMLLRKASKRPGTVFPRIFSAKARTSHAKLKLPKTALALHEKFKSMDIPSSSPNDAPEFDEVPSPTTMSAIAGNRARGFSFAGASGGAQLLVEVEKNRVIHHQSASNIIDFDESLETEPVQEITIE